jgi:protein involved in polysaccharide export with SLBB domain
MEDLSVQSKNIQIKPFDVVTIRRKPGFLELQSVSVSGELQYPGPYVLAKREERVSDLIKRAGGFTPEAYIQGAYIKRYNFDEENKELRKQAIINIQQQFSDSTSSDSAKNVAEQAEKQFDQIPLNINKILLNPGSPEDMVLVPRDELYVPKYNASVKISGGVLFPTQIPYNQNYSLPDYINSAGGVAEDGRKSKSYVLYANGKAATTKNFLFFKSYPEILPGTEIVVPEKTQQENKLSIPEILGISSAIASLAGLVIAIIRL